VHDVAGGVLGHPRRQRPGFPVGPLVGALVAVEGDVEHLGQQRTEAGRQPEQRGRDRGVRESCRVHALGSQRLQVVLDRVEHGQPVGPQVVVELR
jgi:hypothetical protein